MIGKVSFPYRLQQAEAILEDDGRWRCDQIPSLVHALDVLYSPAWEGASPDDPAALRHLRAAARWLGGTAWVDPRWGGGPDGGGPH